MTVDSSAAVEFVADDPRFVRSPQTIEVTDPDAAKNLIRSALLGRMRALAAHGRSAVMLSGGIDSLLVLAAAAHQRLDITAFTVVYPNSDSEELERAQLICSLLDVEHIVVRVSSEQLLADADFCARRLDSSDFWEVGAAMPLVAANTAITKSLGSVPILSGSGADALFHGGTVWDNQSAESLQAATRRIVVRNFTASRPIPDFYDRLIGSESRYIQVFQTWTFWDVSRVIDPRLNFHADTEGRIFDKWLLRSLGEDLGIPRQLTRTTKSPIQVSTGLPSSIVGAVAERMSRDPSNRHYTDPATDSTDVLFCRLYFSTLVHDE